MNDNKPQNVPAPRPQTSPTPSPSQPPPAEALRTLSAQLAETTAALRLVTQERDQEKRRADRLRDDGQRLNLLCDQLRAEVASLTASLSSAEQSLAAASQQLAADALIEVWPEGLVRSGFHGLPASSIHKVVTSKITKDSSGQESQSLTINGDPELSATGTPQQIDGLLGKIRAALGQK